MTLEYRAYRKSDADAVTELLADVFPRHDPPAIAAQLTTAEFASFVQTLLPQAANDGLTIVACNAATGETLGVMLANDGAAGSPDEWSQLSKRFEPIAGILGELDEMYFAGREPRPGEMLHLYLLGVHDRATGQGVGKELVAQAVENGVRKGYRIAYAEATNKISQGIFRGRGFSERAQILYRDYLFHGEKTFAGIADHGGPILMEKVLIESVLSDRR